MGGITSKTKDTLYDLSLKNLILETDQSTLDDNVRLLTYNFFIRSPMLKEEFKLQRIKIFFSTKAHEFDIICFQEVFSTASN